MTEALSLFVASCAVGVLAWIAVLLLKISEKVSTLITKDQEHQARHEREDNWTIERRREDGERYKSLQDAVRQLAAVIMHATDVFNKK